MPGTVSWVQMNLYRGITIQVISLLGTLSYSLDCSKFVFSHGQKVQNPLSHAFSFINIALVHSASIELY